MGSVQIVDILVAKPHVELKMGTIFSIHPAAFHAFTAPHYAAMAVVFGLVLLLAVFQKRLSKNQQLKKTMRTVVPAFVIFLFAVEFIWLAVTHNFDPSVNLPLHICDINFVLVIFLFLFRHQYLFETVYFIGIGGAMQAMLTPSLAYDFPSYHYFFFFCGHGLVILGALWFAMVEKFKPVPFSLVRALIFINLIALLVLPVDLLFNGDYMFLLSKPAATSLFDVLGPWPWYLLSCEGIAFLSFLLLYLPWIRKRRL